MNQKQNRPGADPANIEFCKEQGRIAARAGIRTFAPTYAGMQNGLQRWIVEATAAMASAESVMHANGITDEGLKAWKAGWFEVTKPFVDAASQRCPAGDRASFADQVARLATEQGCGWMPQTPL